MSNNNNAPSDVADLPVLTDDVIALRCLSIHDAPAHLNGEDADKIRWVSGGPGSMERLIPWIEQNQQQWRSSGTRRHFGIRDAQTDELIGNVEAHFALAGLTPGEANISCAVFSAY